MSSPHIGRLLVATAGVLFLLHLLINLATYIPDLIPLSAYGLVVGSAVVLLLLVIPVFAAATLQYSRLPQKRPAGRTVLVLLPVFIYFVWIFVEMLGAIMQGNADTRPVSARELIRFQSSMGMLFSCLAVFRSYQILHAQGPRLRKEEGPR